MIELNIYPKRQPRHGVKEASATLAISILPLTQAVDCRGGLVHILLLLLLYMGLNR